MGMSASQMRYCMLAGRKSDVEFQGQQINQQRTTLATESSAYNSQLLNIKVPTPPSTGDYTKTSYTLSEGGHTYTITGVQPDDKGTWTVNFTYPVITTKGENEGSAIFNKVYRTDTNGDGTIDDHDQVTYTISVGDGSKNLDLANSQEDTTNIKKICDDCGIEKVNGQYPTFFKYTADGKTKYVLESELAAKANTPGTTNNTMISNYIVNTNAQKLESGKYEEALVNWTTSNRMESIVDKNGKEHPLSVATDNDKDAYDDAMNEYEYQKTLYDQTLNGINAKMDIIQAQDKKLELKLQDLDTQQKALDVEMDAVKKVIQKNVDSSFKTFNA